MLRFRNQIRVRLAALRRHLARLQTDRRGNVAITAGILMVPMVGSVGLGFEVSNWYLNKRAMQNAADAAVIAAATNGGSNYDTEAKAVTAQYGFVDGTNNVTVTVSNTAACPGGGNTCYSVTISDVVPLFLSKAVGYQGDITLSGGVAAKSVTSTAVATLGDTKLRLCLLALASSGAPQGIRANGNPKTNMTGCDVMSNTSSLCNGGNLQAEVGIAVKSNNGCGKKGISPAKAVADPFGTQVATNISNIPGGKNGGCASYPQEPTKKNDPALPTSNQLSGSYSWTGNQIFCGDLQLTNNVTIDAPSNAVLVIENGQLDTNGFTLSTTSGSGLTIVFSGDNKGYTHAPTGGGTLDFAAPTSGPWSGIAIVQDPSLTSGVDISAAGNSPTWDITGLVYLPHSSVTFSGAVNKSSFGASCFVMVVDNVLINGTGSILETGGCAAAGLAMPIATVPARGQLVL